MLILKYSFYENFGKILNEATTQKFTIPHGSELTIYVSMCANGIMGFDVQEFPLDNFNSNYLYQSTSKPNENCILYPYNFTIPDFPSNIHHFWLWIMSSILPNNNLKLTIFMSLYLSDTSDRAQNCYSLNSNAFYFYPNQASFIHVTPSIISYLSGKCVIELDLRSEQLPLNLDTNKVGLGIYVNLPNKYEEYKVYGFTDYLSDLGGFYSFIEGIFSFIFGSGKLEPWGKAQILFLFGIPYIIKYSKDLVSSSGGIPLAEKVKVIYLKRMMISL
ncbi:unnamed protein product [Rhizophagus irregularis]|uniref:Uncharacterized protein n=1 Tax=Rhizophagus irregularis TaxID=588596 RepID=A0A915YXX8_9GLOM|nr:unnamed protein product [Rhizophagus irregularis]